MKRKLLKKKPVKKKNKWFLKEAFLNLYVTNGNVTACCEHFQINRDTFYDWCKSDPEFKKAVEAAKQSLMDLVEESAINIAMNGIKRPVFKKGPGGEFIQVGEYSEPDTKLIMFMLEKNKREKYGQQNNGMTTEIVLRLPDNTSGRRELDITPKPKELPKPEAETEINLGKIKEKEE